MADSPASTPSPSASCCSASCCPSPCCCPCAPRIAKLEKTVCRIRLWLFVALGFLVLLIGIAIGSGGARKEMMEHARAMRGGPGPAPMAAPMPMQPPAPPQGGPRMDGGRGPGPGPGMGMGQGPGPEARGGNGNRGGERRQRGRDD